MRELALFAGAGGGILGGHLLGWRTVCAVERDAYAASVLCARQNEGVLAPFPIWDDVCTFDGEPWRGIVDVVSGGFPCQDISAAGKGAGINGERSGLWREMARIVGQVRPRFVLVENSPMLVQRGLAMVLGDLAALGYNARWGVLGAHHVGACHRRDRIWILATDANGEGKHDGSVDAKVASASESISDTNGKAGRPESKRKPRRCHSFKPWNDGEPQHVANAFGERLQGPWAQDLQGARGGEEGGQPAIGSWWQSEPDVGRVADGVAARVDRLKAIGNGQVPAVAALAYYMLSST